MNFEPTYESCGSIVVLITKVVREGGSVVGFFCAATIEVIVEVIYKHITNRGKKWREWYSI